MVFEHIEKLKNEYTDKYVVVEGERPELRRFRNLTGLVRTVNMSGRALVEFDAFDNIAWYDIDVDYLKVVPKPEPKVEAKKPAAKAPAAKKATAPAKASQAAPAKKSGGLSVEDILAAARGGGGAPKTGGAPAAKEPAAKEPAAKRPAATKPAPAAAAAQKPGPMSVADILAAARSNKGDAAAPAAEPEPAPAANDTELGQILEAARRPTAAAAAPEPAAEPESPAAEAAPADPEPAASAAGPLPTETADIIAWCRQHDGE